MSGRTLIRGTSEYEVARLDAVWNARKPDRYPDVIVLAESETDVIEAVRAARERGLRVKVRAGGHSWTASGVRDGGMLIDVSRLKEVTYDPGTATATAQPGAYGGELNQMLATHGRFFPTGHCPTVGLGGYLLQGGWGWGSRALGPACASVRAVDVVTADGELIHADSSHHTDFLWAARGSGPGFFGVVTRFYLDTHPDAAAMFSSVYVYSLDELDTVLRWSLEIAPRMSPNVEFILFGTNPRQPDGVPSPGPTAIQIVACARADSADEARDMLEIFESCPSRERAFVNVTSIPITLDQLHHAVDALEPSGYRWSADNMWTSAPADELVPAVHELFTTVPNPVSHVMWYPWRQQPIENAALSLTADLYIAAYAGWKDPADDAQLSAWPGEQLRRLEPLAKGIQLADENLIGRPAKFMSEASEARLEQLRAKHDPDGRFLSYLSAV